MSTKMYCTQNKVIFHHSYYKCTKYSIRMPTLLIVIIIYSIRIYMDSLHKWLPHQSISMSCINIALTGRIPSADSWPAPGSPSSPRSTRSSRSRSVRSRPAGGSWVRTASLHSHQEEHSMSTQPLAPLIVSLHRRFSGRAEEVTSNILINILISDRALNVTLLAPCFVVGLIRPTSTWFCPSS